MLVPSSNSSAPSPARSLDPVHPASQAFDVLWLSVSPSLKRFDQPLLQHLCRHQAIAQWEYLPDPDEGSSLDKAVVLLHDYLKHRDRPVHLAGHGMGGVVALHYARRYRRRVRSLALLGVGAQPAATWHAHYYVQRHLFPQCSRDRILAQTVQALFGRSLRYPMKDLVVALKRDLDEAPSIHSLLKVVTLPKAGVMMPLLVCGSQTDAIVPPPMLYDWANYFTSSDRLWLCPDGHHFFHFNAPEQVSQPLTEFWQVHSQDASEMQTKSVAKQSTLSPSFSSTRAGSNV